MGDYQDFAGDAGIEGGGIDGGGLYDTDADGIVDMATYDADGDGIVDQAAYDTDRDGIADVLATDRNLDGVTDVAEVDTDGDGVVDTVLSDETYDGYVDQAVVDLDGDAVADAVVPSAPLFDTGDAGDVGVAAGSGSGAGDSGGSGSGAGATELDRLVEDARAQVAEAWQRVEAAGVGTSDLPSDHVADPSIAQTASTGYPWLDDLNSQILGHGQWVEDFAEANGFDHYGMPDGDTALEIGARNAELWDPYNAIPGGSSIVSDTVAWAKDLNGGSLPPSSGVYGPEIAYNNTGWDGQVGPGWNVYDYFYENQALL